jgi:hypothetical protein
MTSRTIDLRHSRRVATAACVVIAPALLGVIRGFYPAFTASTAPVVIADFHHHLDDARVELAACLLAVLVLPFFVLGLYRLTSRRAPVLAAIGAVVGLVGWIAIPFLGAPDALAYELARHGGSAAIYDRFANHDAFIGVGTTIFLIGHELGTIILGAALWRAGAVRKWAASLFVVGPVAHFAAVIGGARWLDVVPFALLTLGGAAAARAIAATSDEEWDLPPADGAEPLHASAQPARLPA